MTTVNTNLVQLALQFHTMSSSRTPANTSTCANATKVHAARNLGPVCDTLNRMKPEERRALREAYAASA